MLKQKIIAQIEDQGVIAIIRGVKSEKFAPLLIALDQGGVCVAEVTFGAQSDQETCELLKTALSLAKPYQYIGAGTVTCLERAKLAFEAGAKFIVSPNVNKEVIEFCKRNNLCVISGALTPTEVYNAYEYGADFVKIFPSNIFGASYFKALKGPMPNIPLIAFGGINEGNLGEYLSAGAIGAGVGSELINLKAIENDDFEYVKNKAQSFINCVKLSKK